MFLYRRVMFVMVCEGRECENGKWVEVMVEQK